MVYRCDPVRTPWQVFWVFLRLGLTSFGGPIAHLGFFRDEFVTRRRWLSDRSYADLVTLCQFLPGPASSQVGIALGLARAGYAGALAAWIGFTLPSALMLTLLALGLGSYADLMPPGVLQGLKVVAVAVVAQAVSGMARSLCPDAPRLALMAAVACLLLWLPSAWAQVGVLVAAGMVGMMLFKPAPAGGPDPLPISIRPRPGILWLTLFLVLLLGLPLLARLWPSQPLSVVDAFYRTGALVFGGGHVMLPLLQVEVVPSGWVSQEAFLTGYGATQAVPGPLFTFAAFLGACMNGPLPAGLSAVLCLLAIFAPSFLLVFGALPFWDPLRRSRRMQAAMLGINAAVVGLLLAALYQPLWTGAIHGAEDAALALALVAWMALVLWRLPPWLVVASCGLLGGVLGGLSG
jgi:chromate transporter